MPLESEIVVEEDAWVVRHPVVIHVLISEMVGFAVGALLLASNHLDVLHFDAAHLLPVVLAAQPHVVEGHVHALAVGVEVVNFDLLHTLIKIINKSLI